MKDLYIIGGGGFATEVLFLIERLQRKKLIWKNIYIIDKNLKTGTFLRNYLVVGSDDFLLNINYYYDVIVTINNPIIRKEIVDRICTNNPWINFPNIFDPSIIIDKDNFSIGQGNIFMHHVIISTSINIGNFNIINSYTGIGHDSTIGNYNTFNPRVAISGNVSIGDLNIFGLNSGVLQGIKIGSHNEVWYNTIIFRNVSNSTKYFGFPAKKLSL